MTDQDLDKAEMVLMQLAAAQQQPAERSIQTLRKTVNLAKNSGLRPLDIEKAQADACLAIAIITRFLEINGTCAADHWDDAIRQTRRWRALLT